MTREQVLKMLAMDVDGGTAVDSQDNVNENSLETLPMSRIYPDMEVDEIETEDPQYLSVVSDNKLCIKNIISNSDKD